MSMGEHNLCALKRVQIDIGSLNDIKDLVEREVVGIIAHLIHYVESTTRVKLSWTFSVGACLETRQAASCANMPLLSPKPVIDEFKRRHSGIEKPDRYRYATRCMSCREHIPLEKQCDKAERVVNRIAASVLKLQAHEASG